LSNDHSNLAVVLAWLGLLAGFLTPIAILLTIMFTGINIYMALRKLRREVRLEKLQAELQRPEAPQ
jgi:4-hydroxybenzoate polyprenyltransferase